MTKGLVWLLVLLCLLAVGLTAGVAWYAWRGVGLPRPVELAAEKAAADDANRSEKQWNLFRLPNFCPSQLEKKNVLNVLVAGVDGRLTAPFERRGRGRTDSIHLLRLYREGKHAVVLSIPRDLRVQLGDGQGMAKINAAYAQGGAPQLIRTVERFLSLDDKAPVAVDHHLVVNLEAFIGVVDAFGGIDLEVDKRMKYRDRWGGLDIDLQPGRQHLTGVQAMGFVRFRKDREGDLRRIVRQQQFAREFIAQTSGFTNRFRLRRIYKNLAREGHIQTDLGFCDLLAMKNAFEGQDVDQRLIPLTVGVADLRLGRVSYLQPLEREQREINRLLLRQPPTSRFLTQEPLRLVNTCPDEQRGRFVKGLLRANGVRFAAETPLHKNRPRQTGVYGEVSPAMQKKLARVLGAENVVFHGPDRWLGDFTPALSASSATTPLSGPAPLAAPLSVDSLDAKADIVLGLRACQGL